MCRPADAAPFYEQTCEELGWNIDARKLEELQGKNTARVNELNERIEDAEKNMGDIEVRDACLAKAVYLADIGAYLACHSQVSVSSGDANKDSSRVLSELGFGGGGGGGG